MLGGNMLNKKHLKFYFLTSVVTLGISCASAHYETEVSPSVKAATPYAGVCNEVNKRLLSTEDIKVGMTAIKEVSSSKSSIEFEPKEMFTTTTINLREKPSLNAQTIKILNAGRKVKVLGYADKDWSSIEVDSKKGFVNSKYLSNKLVFKKLSSTAYCSNATVGADGTKLKVNFTLAGKKEWLGKGCYLYRCNKDGSVGKKLGYYEFHDVGYGREVKGTGATRFSCQSGKAKGDIELGYTIDIFHSTRDACVSYGRQDVYLAWAD